MNYNSSSAEHKINGSFGDKDIRLRMYRAPNSNRILVNIHGTYGSMYSSSNKYVDLAQTLSSKNITNVILYESSRKRELYKEKMTYAEKQGMFEGKTFQNEFDDLIAVLTYVKNVQNSLSEAPLELHLNGNSLGGILALLATSYFSIETVNTVGAGVRIEHKNVPILSTYPDQSHIKELLKAYKGKFLMHYGTFDEIFDRGNFSYLFTNVGTENKHFLKYDGVGHDFETLFGKVSDMPYKEVTKYIEKLILGDKLTSGAIYLRSNDYEKQIQIGRNDFEKQYKQDLLDNNLSKYFTPVIDDDELGLNVE